MICDRRMNDKADGDNRAYPLIATPDGNGFRPERRSCGNVDVVRARARAKAKAKAKANQTS